MADRDHHIRVIAYRLWEEAGRPEGQDEYFWHVAVEQYDMDLAPSAPLPREEPVPEAEETAAKTEPGVSEAEPEAPASKKRTGVKAKSPASQPAAEPEKPEPEAKAAKAKEDGSKTGKAKTSKPKTEAPATPSWIKSEPTAPKGGKRRP